MSDVTVRRLDVGALELLREGWWLVRDRYGFFLFTTLMALLVGSLVPFQLLTGAAMCGIQLSYLLKVDGRKPTWEALMKGMDFFLPSLAATYVSALVMLIPMLPLFAMLGVWMYQVFVGSLEGTSAAYDPASMIAFMLAMGGLALLVQINILFLFMFAYILIVDKGVGGVRALGLSARAVWHNLAGLINVLMLLSAILLLPVLVPIAAGWVVSWALSFVLGMLVALLVSVVTLPVLFGVITVAYRRIFPAEVVA